VGRAGVNRDENLRRLADPAQVWDVLIIGGGATGLGAAVEAATRGYRTLLLEQEDFAKATSSRSTKLAHGGVRYLQQGNVALVLHALRERGLMVRNAPHLVHALEFVIPAYRGWEKAFYGLGLTVYDALSGRLSLGHSRLLSRARMLELLPTVQARGLRGGILYTDGQFDDARLAITLAQTAHDAGGVALNYFRVTGLLKENGRVCGALAVDRETGREYRLQARTVLNATGIFTDSVRKFDDPAAKDMLSVSQGAHLVLDRSFLPGGTALMVPHTDDGRVLFAVPWHRHVIVGTTDLSTPHISLEPKPMEEEIEFLLRHASHYLSRPVGRADVLSIYAGQRPLVKADHGEKTSALSRDHTVITSKSNLVTITGGKWTTYRRMGQDAVDHLAEVGGLPPRASRTAQLHLHGYLEGTSPADPHSVYGSDYAQIIRLAEENPAGDEPLHARLPYTGAEVIWAARHEMARTVEDVLARRTRALLLDARASIEMAVSVGRLLAAELGRDEAWQKEQVRQFTQLAENYLLL
jgi:glycerol-3-phosphate dehydrogenase